MREEEKLVGESHTVSACFPLTSRDFSRHEKGTGEKRLCSCLQAKQRGKRGIAKKGEEIGLPLQKGGKGEHFSSLQHQWFFSFSSFAFAAAEEFIRRRGGGGIRRGGGKKFYYVIWENVGGGSGPFPFPFFLLRFLSFLTKMGERKNTFLSEWVPTFFTYGIIYSSQENSLLLTVFWDFQVVNVCKKSGKSCFSRITFGKLRWRRACFIAECVISPFPFFLFRKYTGERSEPRWILFWSEGNEIIKGF